MNNHHTTKIQQIALMYQYQQLLTSNKPHKFSFDDVGFRVFSQFNEDGILLYIFSLIGTTNRKCIEMCSGVGYESNTANLIVNHAWNGLLLDGDQKATNMSKEFFSNHPDTFWLPPTIAQEWITADNVNDIIERYNFEGEIDLLSLDLDGVDYWIWTAIENIRPRVVVAEINDLWPADVSVAIHYQDNFQYSNDKEGYVGASLGAWIKLAKSKGYRLVGRNRNCLNAFFVRNDIKCPLLPTIKAEDFFDIPAIQRKQTAFREKLDIDDWVLV
ncbi:MAG TPA: hypothetical protein PLS49_02430 [Candidatus Woesebacteria bacterium]|nr:hypothetical protein [Candidatus Woesebacteria bacterium]